jgi:hypothetical protein
MLCRCYHLRLIFAAGYQIVELICIRFSSWGCQVEGPPPLMFLAYRLCWWTSLVIYGLLANPFVSTMCRFIDYSLLLNEKRVICLI